MLCLRTLVFEQKVGGVHVGQSDDVYTQLATCRREDGQLALLALLPLTLTSATHVH